MRLGLGHFLVALERSGLNPDDRRGDQQQPGHHQRQGGQFHADPQHEQDVEAGEHALQQPPLQQLLDLGAQFIQGTEPQLQVADVALPEELGGQPQQPVHRRQLGAGGTALLTQQQGPTLHPLQADPQHTSCHQNSADLQQQPQVAVGQRLVGDHRVEGGCEQPQQGGEQHHGNTDAEAPTEQPQAGAGERSGGTHAKNPAGRPHIAADGQQKSKAHPDQQAADHVEAGLAWFAVGKAQ